MALFLKRDTKVYLRKLVSTTPNPDTYVVWELPVLDGFTFSQGNTTSEVTLNEMAGAAGASKRGRRIFNDALAPAEWSFSTYVRPFKSTGAGSGKADDTANIHHAIEEALWANFVGTGLPTNTGASTYMYDFGQANLSQDVTDLDITWANSGFVTLGTFDLFFVMGATLDGDLDYDDPADAEVIIYKIADCVVNEATINFDVEGIAMIEWSGMGTTLTREATFDLANDAAVTLVREGITSTNNFIRNKLTSLSCTAANTTAYPGASSNGVYNITLTGGSITFSNNITFLTPEVLGIVNTPIGHITGNKSISGNFTAYIEELSSNVGTSSQLIQNALADTTTITNSFALTFVLGGSGNTPRMEISVPTAHLEIPTINTDDVIAMDVAFHGLPSTITANDEVAVKYVGA
jgi:hypothetical protein